MLWTTSSLLANELKFADYINCVNDGKVIVEKSDKESRIAYCTSGANLVFARVRQAFSGALILYYFDQKMPYLD